MKTMYGMDSDGRVTTVDPHTFKTGGADSQRCKQVVDGPRGRMFCTYGPDAAFHEDVPIDPDHGQPPNRAARRGTVTHPTRHQTRFRTLPR